MSIFNQTFLPIIQGHINQIRAEGKNAFHTVDVIRRYTGHYISDETNTNESLNANIGKFIKENMEVLEIDRETPDQPVTDDNGRASHSSLWEFN